MKKKEKKYFINYPQDKIQELLQFLQNKYDSSKFSNENIQASDSFEYLFRAINIPENNAIYASSEDGKACFENKLIFLEPIQSLVIKYNQQKVSPEMDQFVTSRINDGGIKLYLEDCNLKNAYAILKSTYTYENVNLNNVKQKENFTLYFILSLAHYFNFVDLYNNVFDTTLKMFSQVIKVEKNIPPCLQNNLQKLISKMSVKQDPYCFPHYNCNDPMDIVDGMSTGVPTNKTPFEEENVTVAINPNLIDKIKTKKPMTSQKEKEKQFKEITDKMFQLFCKKNQDYTADNNIGSAFDVTYDILGPMSPANRFLDKVLRYISLSSNKEQMVKDEKIEDTLIDLANYAILTLIKIKENNKSNNTTK